MRPTHQGRIAGFEPAISINVTLAAKGKNGLRPPAVPMTPVWARSFVATDVKL